MTLSENFKEVDRLISMSMEFLSRARGLEIETGLYLDGLTERIDASFKRDLFDPMKQISNKVNEQVKKKKTDLKTEVETLVKTELNCLNHQRTSFHQKLEGKRCALYSLLERATTKNPSNGSGKSRKRAGPLWQELLTNLFNNLNIDNIEYVAEEMCRGFPSMHLSLPKEKIAAAEKLLLEAIEDTSVEFSYWRPDLPLLPSPDDWFSPEKLKLSVGDTFNGKIRGEMNEYGIFVVDAVSADGSTFPNKSELVWRISERLRSRILTNDPAIHCLDRMERVPSSTIIAYKGSMAFRGRLLRHQKDKASGIQAYLIDVGRVEEFERWQLFVDVEPALELDAISPLSMVCCMTSPNIGRLLDMNLAELRDAMKRYSNFKRGVLPVRVVEEHQQADGSPVFKVFLHERLQGLMESRSTSLCRDFRLDLDPSLEVWRSNFSGESVREAADSSKQAADELPLTRKDARPFLSAPVDRELVRRIVDAEGLTPLLNTLTKLVDEEDPRLAADIRKFVSQRQERLEAAGANSPSEESEMEEVPGTETEGKETTGVSAAEESGGEVDSRLDEGVGEPAVHEGAEVGIAGEESEDMKASVNAGVEMDAVDDSEAPIEEGEVEFAVEGSRKESVDDADVESPVDDGQSPAGEGDAVRLARHAGSANVWRGNASEEKDTASDSKHQEDVRPGAAPSPLSEGREGKREELDPLMVSHESLKSDEGDSLDALPKPRKIRWYSGSSDSPSMLQLSPEELKKALEEPAKEEKQQAGGEDADSWDERTPVGAGKEASFQAGVRDSRDIQPRNQYPAFRNERQRFSGGRGNRPMGVGEGRRHDERAPGRYQAAQQSGNRAVRQDRRPIGHRFGERGQLCQTVLPNGHRSEDRGSNSQRTYPSDTRGPYSTQGGHASDVGSRRPQRGLPSDGKGARGSQIHSSYDRGPHSPAVRGAHAQRGDQSAMKGPYAQPGSRPSDSRAGQQSDASAQYSDAGGQHGYPPDLSNLPSPQSCQSSERSSHSENGNNPWTTRGPRDYPPDLRGDAGHHSEVGGPHWSEGHSSNTQRQYSQQMTPSESYRSQGHSSDLGGPRQGSQEMRTNPQGAQGPQESRESDARGPQTQRSQHHLGRRPDSRPYSEDGGANLPQQDPFYSSGNRDRPGPSGSGKFRRLPEDRGRRPEPFNDRGYKKQRKGSRQGRGGKLDTCHIGNDRQYIKEGDGPFASDYPDHYQSRGSADVERSESTEAMAFRGHGPSERRFKKNKRPKNPHSVNRQHEPDNQSTEEQQPRPLAGAGDGHGALCQSASSIYSGATEDRSDAEAKRSVTRRGRGDFTYPDGGKVDERMEYSAPPDRLPEHEDARPAANVSRQARTNAVRQTAKNTGRQTDPERGPQMAE